MISRRFALYLMPTIWRVGLAILVLPLTTYRLDPADFGLFALILSLATFGTGASGLGAAYPISNHLPVLDQAGRQALVSTLLWLGLGVGLLFAMAVLFAWPWIVRLVPDIASAPASASWIAAGLIVLGVPWNYAVAIITVTGRASQFAAVTVAESAVATGVTLFALYGLDFGVQSLLIGALAGAATNAVGSLLALRGLIRVAFSRVWIVECMHVGGLSLIGALVERGQVMVERYAFARYVGLTPLGIYSHSQQYFEIAKAGVKAVTNATWPVALEEARAADKSFPQLGLYWPPTHLALALAGIAMATVGRDAIALLTHGKFTEAYVFAALWIILVLLANAARPAVAIVYAHGYGVANQWTLIVGGFLTAGLMIPMIKHLGALGAVLANFVSVLIYRSVIVVIARRVAAVPFQDGPLLAGVAAVVAALGTTLTLGHSLLARVAIMIVFCVILLVACRHAWRPLLGIVLKTSRAAAT
jgi:O-antigen/teichoic acid export membrane protein